jgi:hypothetical protein
MSFNYRSARTEHRITIRHWTPSIQTSETTCPAMQIAADQNHGLRDCENLKTRRIKHVSFTSLSNLRTTIIKSMVNCTLVQALRLRTGRTAHRGSRHIAILFHDHGTRRGWGVSATPRSLFTPGKDPVPIVQKAGWAPGPAWTGAENLAPTGIRSPNSPVRSQTLYQLSYPAHKDCNNKQHKMRRSAQIVKCSLLDDKNLNFTQFILKKKKAISCLWFCLMNPQFSRRYDVQSVSKKCTSSLCNQNLIPLYAVYHVSLAVIRTASPYP